MWPNTVFGMLAVSTNGSLNTLMTNQSDTDLIVFSDFDGTIATRDVGNRLFHHFSGGNADEPVARWKAGEIDSRVCLLEEAALMRDVSREELDAFIDTFEIDPGFSPFVDLCRNRGWPLYIFSDGLDIYIARLLDKYGLAHLPVMTNHAVLADGRLKIDFPYYEHTCGGCANCKGYQVRRLRQAGRKAVYIGDGKSDLCAVPEVDLVYARDYLAEYCTRENIPFVSFKTFADIAERLGSVPAGSANHRH